VPLEHQSPYASDTRECKIKKATFKLTCNFKKMRKKRIMVQFINGDGACVNNINSNKDVSRSDSEGERLYTCRVKEATFKIKMQFEKRIRIIQKLMQLVYRDGACV